MDGGSHTVAAGLFVFWILTFAAWAQNELLWQVLLFSVLHECGHLTALCALGLQPRQLRLSFYGMALRYDRVPDRRRETAVLFGGPVVNLILWVLLRNPANGALFLLNMLPIFRWMGDGWRRFGCHNDWRPCSAR